MMKKLSNFVFESLFDDDLIDNKYPLDLGTINDKNGDFYRMISIDSINKYIPIDIESTESSIIIKSPKEIHINTNIKYPLFDHYDLYAHSVYMGFAGSYDKRNLFFPPIINNHGFNKIYTNYLCINSNCKKIKNSSFIITKNPPITNASDILKVTITGEIDFDNVNIEFEDNNKSHFNPPCIIFSNISEDLPDLKGLTSNCQAIHAYGASLFDLSKIKDKMDKFLSGMTLELKDNKKPALPPKKTPITLRKLVAVFNNFSKYGVPALPKPNGKVSDLFGVDLKKFKNLKTISLFNNNVEISFVRPYDHDAINAQARYMRLNDFKTYKDYTISQIEYMLYESETDDGWIMTAMKKYF